MDHISQIKEYLKTEPEDNFLQHALALEYIKTGNDAEAKILFEKILEREPGYVGSYYHLGKLCERIGETEKAIEIYNKGMKMANVAKDLHAYNELQSACEDVEDNL
jgi:Tfp pilus assembly protein PilF